MTEGEDSTYVPEPAEAEESSSCNHVGSGAYCHLCGEVKLGRTPEAEPKCEAGHGHIKDVLHRKFCTYCGKEL